MEKRRFYKKFGETADEDCLTLEVTTWDGLYPVLVIFPKKITKKIKAEVEDFLLSELDDHDGLNKFRLLCDLVETAKQKKKNLKDK